jgi:Protein of unknown function (DUF2950)
MPVVAGIVNLGIVGDWGRTLVDHELIEFRNGERAMLGTNSRLKNSGWDNGCKVAVVTVMLMGWLAAGLPAQEKGQKTFASAEEASQVLVTAIQSNDEKAILDILGQDAKQIVSSGDDVEDKANRADFVKNYQEMHRLVKEPDGTTSLYIGAKNWPTPIPLVNNGSAWYFDTASGKQEILFRRIGQNEMSAIRVCEQLAAAEKEYYLAQHNEYAQKIISDDGKPDGLYWKAADGAPQSPIGPLVAMAGEGFGKSQSDAPTPYRGYYFHVLTAQGKNAPGGAKSYVVNGKMTEGFAFVAYPAEYKSSGVMTFLVDTDGVVYEKDLGKKTETAAKSMKEYNPSAGWHQPEEMQADSADQQSAK